eukprot:9909530-Karenia_brevis.AAC.1
MFKLTYCFGTCRFNLVNENETQCSAFDSHCWEFFVLMFVGWKNSRASLVFPGYSAPAVHS